MYIRKMSAIAVALAVPGLLAAGPAAADPVCYRNADDYNNSTRIVLDVKRQSRLFGGQTVYEADGKHSYVDNTKYLMAVFDGAVVTSRGSQYQPKGAHLGGESYFVRGAPPPAAQGGSVSSPIAWECTSGETSATPHKWYCTIGGGVTTQKYNLERVYGKDPLCDVFQNGVSYPPSPQPY